MLDGLLELRLVVTVEASSQWKVRQARSWNKGWHQLTNYFISGFSEALADEVGDLAIKVCCVEPGDFRTSRCKIVNVYRN